MGGDGPHYSPPLPSPIHRNSSFGMAMLRPDRFVGLKASAGATGTGTGSGTATTEVLTATGRYVLVTADAVGGSVTVQLNLHGGHGGQLPCNPVTGRNVTDEQLSGCVLPESSVGSNVTMTLKVEDSAILYIVGFHAA